MKCILCGKELVCSDERKNEYESEYACNTKSELTPYGYRPHYRVRRNGEIQHIYVGNVYLHGYKDYFYHAKTFTSEKWGQSEILIPRERVDNAKNIEERIKMLMVFS